MYLVSTFHDTTPAGLTDCRVSCVFPFFIRREFCFPSVQTDSVLRAVVPHGTFPVSVKTSFHLTSKDSAGPYKGFSGVSMTQVQTPSETVARTLDPTESSGTLTDVTSVHRSLTGIFQTRLSVLVTGIPWNPILRLFYRLNSDFD